MSTPTMETAIAVALDARARAIRTAIPGRVESYDAARQRASVQPLIREARVDESGARVAERLPVVNDVPVVFPGAGGYSIVFPVSAGDTVLLIFSQASLDKWLTRGDDVDPLDDRAHHLSDAIAVPGLRHTAAPDGGVTGALVVTGDQIQLGSKDASDGAIKGTQRDTAEQIFLTALGTLVAALVDTTAVPTAAKTAFATALAVWKPAATAAVSTKVRVE